MEELGLDVQTISSWFMHEQDEPYVFIRVPSEYSDSWDEVLGEAVRRCYITDENLEERAQVTGYLKSMIVTAKLPPRGSTMAGDFGEILVYLYHAVLQNPKQVIGPKKWRLKQDSTMPAPHADVITFVLPEWPDPSADDILLCSEVKTKSTNRNWSPILAAIEDCEKDRISRLTRTLVWLRERALTEDLGSTHIEHLERFIQAPDYPPAEKQFRAVAVVSDSLVMDELPDAPVEAPTDYILVVITVPNLKKVYEDVYDAVHATVVSSGETL